MRNAANRAARRLWQDESGVVLAVTVIIFLTLFLMACSVYAIGETVRQRAELSLVETEGWAHRREKGGFDWGTISEKGLRLR